MQNTSLLGKVKSVTGLFAGIESNIPLALCWTLADIVTQC